MVKKTAIQAALLRQMLAAGNTAIITAVLLAAILAYVQSEVIAPTVIFAWLACIVSISLARAILALAYQRAPLSDDTPADVRLLRFRLGVLAIGMAWGMAGIVMFPPHDPAHQMFLIFMLAGLTAGGVVAYSADLFSALGFSVSALLPAIVRLIAAGDGMSTTMGVAAALYMGFMVMSLRYINGSIRGNIILRLEASTRQEAARANEERYRLLLNHSPVGIIHYDTDLVITYCNKRFAEILHNSPGGLVALDMKSLRQQAILPALSKALDGELGYYEGHYAATHSNASVWITMTCAPSRDGAGKIVGGVAILQDLTELHESHEHMYSLLNSMAEGAYGVDMNGTCEFVNRSFLRILGYEHADQVVGKNIHELIHHSHPDGTPYPAAECRMYKAFQDNEEAHVADEVFWRKDGVAVPVEYWSQPILVDGVVHGAIATFIDISERKAAEQKIHHLAYYDTLTNLPNRRLLMDRLNQALGMAERHRRPFAVMFLDLDNFKDVNDTLGHDVGDQLLQAVAARLNGCVRSVDTLCRHGGDEFVIVLTELAQPHDAALVADKILETLREPIPLGEHQLRITTSIGIAVYSPDSPESAHELMKHADTAMYAAKGAGRNQYRFAAAAAEDIARPGHGHRSP